MTRSRRVMALVFVAFLLAGALAPSAAWAAMDGYEVWTDFLPPMPPLNIPIPIQVYDNTLGYANSNGIFLGGTTTHNFETNDTSSPDYALHDRDWSSFTAVAGTAYTITAFPYPQTSVANPVMYLYDSNRITRLRASDDGVFGDPTAKIKWVCPTSGTYYVEVLDWYGSTGGQPYTLSLQSETGMTAWTTHRPDAPDRYTLAANLAVTAWPGWAGVDDVVVACGADRAAADPLTASGLAGVYDAPILLVQTDPTRVAVPAPTKNALAAIRAATGVKPQIHVVGGPASVTPAQLTVLKAYDKDGVIDRVGGIDRYQVAANVAARMRSVLGAAYPKKALFANGYNPEYFWNALAAGPAAFRMHYPILLTTKAGLPASTNAQKGYYTTRYLVGTPMDTYAPVQAALGATRIGWDPSDGYAYDRCRVARRFAEYAAGPTRMWEGFNDPSNFTDVGFANRLADSLVGGTFMGKINGTYGGALLFAANANQLDPIILAPLYSGRPVGTNYDFLVARGHGDNHQCWILGGTASMSLVVENNIGTALNNIY